MKCLKCRRVLPEEEFNLRKDSNKVRNNCKKCQSNYSKAYYQENKEKLKKRCYQWKKEHKDERKKYSEEYYQKNKITILEKQRKKREDLSANKKKEGKKYHCNYYQDNKEIWRQYQKHRNPIAKQFYDRKRRLKKMQLFQDFSNSEWKQKVSETNGICPICKRPYSEVYPFCVTIDHVPAISKAPINFHYTIENVSPMCGSCNSSKGCN